MDEEDAEPVTPRAFQTLIGQALPAPLSPKVFQTLMMQAPPLPPLAPRPAPPMPAAPVIAAPEQQPKPKPAAPAAPVAPDQQPKPRPAIFATTVMRTIPPPDDAGANVGDTIQISGAEAQAAIAAYQPQASDSTDRRLDGAKLDLRHSPVVQRELPGLQTAFDGEAMRGYLQAVLFGKTRPTYRIERCTPGKAIYLGDSCVLRYELDVKDSASGATLQPLVVGRVFGDQLACAVYLRDKLSPLAALMRGREEVAPFATPVAMVEPLNMVVHVFPIDGELPTLVGATDGKRMLDIFGETLPEALTDRFAPQSCRMSPANYARRYRCVLRYEIEGLAPGGKTQRRVVYGKIATDSQGALIAPLVAALREQLSGQFSIPRSLGYRPDLQISLLEGIPGTPRINQLLKARLSGAEAPGDGLTLEGALDACARIAGALHDSKIALGRRRTLDDDLKALQRDIDTVRRVAPPLGEQFQSWLERIENYAEESDPLQLVFSHGDYTYAQVIFDGASSGLVDFDTVCQAEPALDLGQFLAYLRVAAHKARRAATPGAAPIGEQLGEHFLSAYVAAAGDHLEDAERLRIRASVYEIVSLMRMALHSWQQIKPARLENALAVLEEALARLPQLDY